MSPKARTTATPGDGNTERAAGSPLRADAARNVAQIRAAAVAAFRGRGLSTPLEEIAAAAGVSKATVYNRFGGRLGLIDAVIEELVATEMHAITDRAAHIDDPWERLATFVTDRRDLLYREPAAIDCLLMTYPDSQRLVALADESTDTTRNLIRHSHDAGVLRRDFTAGDLYHADVATGLALRHAPIPPREDYDRRTRFFLDSLRPH